MSATRAGGVRCAKVSAFRVVRNLENACSLCEQAADKASRKAAVGASGALPATALLAFETELDSCAATTDAKSNNREASLTKAAAHRNTSILCYRKNRRQILREDRARHHL